MVVVLVALIVLNRLITKYLLPPFIQLIIKKSKLNFSRVIIRSIQSDGKFVMEATGSIQDSGPFPAIISFIRPAYLKFANVLSQTFYIDTPKTPKQEDLYYEGDVICAIDKMPSLHVSPSLGSIVQGSTVNGRNRDAVDGSPFSIKVDANVVNEELFGLFGAKLLNSEYFTWTLQATTKVSSFFLNVQPIPMVKEIRMKGMAGLNRVSVQEINVTKGTTDHVLMETSLIMENVSDVGIEMGTVKFLVLYDSEIVGYCIMRDVMLMPGQNHLGAEVYFCPERDNSALLFAARKMMSNFIQGKSNNVQIIGYEDSAPQYPFMQTSFESLRIPTSISGISMPLISSATMFLMKANPVTLTAPSQLVLVNPFDETIRITRMKGHVSMMDRIIGEIDVDLMPSVSSSSWRNDDSQVITIGGRQEVETGPIYLKLKINFIAINALLQAATNSLYVDVQSTIGCYVGDYATEIDYEQFDVPVQLG